MTAFFGLMLLIGVFRASRDPVNCIYSDDPNYSRPIFRDTMPRDRFKLILRFRDSITIRQD